MQDTQGTTNTTPEPQPETSESESPQEESVPDASPEEGKPEGSNEKLIKEFPKQEKVSYMKTIVIILVLIIAGIGTGYLLSSQGESGKPLKSSEAASEEGVKVGDAFGSQDKETFRDDAEGIIVKGGIDGEGSHRLLRPGGESQNVYLTSSVVDLDLFVDHKLKIWGETFAAQKAGWLMDVGRVEVVELNSEKPSESLE